MHGLGEILNMNKKLGNLYGHPIGRNGSGTPWEVRYPIDACSRRDENPFHVVRVSDGAVVGCHPNLKKGRKQVAALMRAAAEHRIT